MVVIAVHLGYGSASVVSLADARLSIPTLGRSMRLIALPDPSRIEAELLKETPIVVAHGGSSPAVVFDAASLAEDFGAKWPEVDRILSEIEPSRIYPEVLQLIDRGALLADASPILAAAEARLVEGPDQVALAALVLVLIQSRLTLLLDP